MDFLRRKRKRKPKATTYLAEPTSATAAPDGKVSGTAGMDFAAGVDVEGEGMTKIRMHVPH